MKKPPPPTTRGEVVYQAYLAIPDGLDEDCMDENVVEAARDAAEAFHNLATALSKGRYGYEGRTWDTPAVSPYPMKYLHDDAWEAFLEHFTGEKGDS